jgi:hypothetical protein
MATYKHLPRCHNKFIFDVRPKCSYKQTIHGLLSPRRANGDVSETVWTILILGLLCIWKQWNDVVFSEVSTSIKMTMVKVLSEIALCRRAQLLKKSTLERGPTCRGQWMMASSRELNWSEVTYQRYVRTLSSFLIRV